MTTTTAILPNEKELLQAIANGSEAAFTQVFHHYSPRIYAFVLGKTKSATIAEEVVQEVFMKVWTMKEKVLEIEKFASYLFSMTANKTYDQLKSIAKDIDRQNMLYEAIQEIALNNEVQELLDYKQSRELLNKAIEELPAQRKKIYILNKEEGLSYDQIATKLGISKNTVSNQLVEASKFIRNYIRDVAGPGAILSLILFEIIKH